MSQENNAAAVPINIADRRYRVEHDVRIGKDVLELLTGAMYVDPLTIYREYLQNAADAIDEAFRAGLLESQSHGRVEIHLSSSERSIRIRDNGIGVPGGLFVDTLTAIGDSNKRGKLLRGFRGVGRLSGLGYAQEVRFRSRSTSDRRITEIIWQGRKLRELLRNPDHQGGLTGIVREVVEVTNSSGDNYPSHFFEVELRGVSRIGNDLLLNPDEVKQYLAQAAPVPFSPAFPFKDQLHSLFDQHRIGRGITVTVNSDPNPIHRPFKSGFPVSNKAEDRFLELETIEIPGLNNSVDAVAWVLHHSYYGAIGRRLGLAGLRARVGNIQVGDSSLFDPIYPERRFNSWCIGEIHVLTDRILPNGRRDDFEINAHQHNLLSHAALLAGRLTKICREKSILRNRLRSAYRLYEQAKAQIQSAHEPRFHSLSRAHYASRATRSIAELERLASRTKFSDTERGLLVEKLSELTTALKRKPVRKTATTLLRHLSPVKRKSILETIDIVLESCTDPKVAADIVQRILQKSRKRT